MYPVRLISCFRGDSLAKYVKKTLHQLNTKENALIRPKLLELGMYPDVSQCFLKGYLFFRLTDEYYRGGAELSEHARITALSPLPASVFAEVGLSATHSRGWWARYHHEFSYDPEEIQTRLLDGEMILGAMSTAEMLAAEAENTELDETDFEEDVLLLETDSNPLKLRKLLSSRWIVRLLLSLSRVSQTFIQILNKNDYLAPVWVTPERVGPSETRVDDRLVPMTYSQLKRAIKRHFKKNFRSIFVAEVVPFNESVYAAAPNPTGALFVEVCRGFVVGNYWPDPPKDLVGLEKLL